MPFKSETTIKLKMKEEKETEIEEIVHHRYIMHKMSFSLTFKAQSSETKNKNISAK